MMTRLMAIDDDPLSLSLLSMLLESEGFSVMQALSGEEALRELEPLDRADWPQVLLVDLQMPGLSGPKLAAALRERSGDDEMIMLAMSATAVAAPEGYAGFLLKPLAVDRLKATLAGVAGGHKQPDHGSGLPALDQNTYEKLLAIIPRAALDEIYAVYLHDTRARIKKMRVAVRSGHMQPVRSAAHAIKGSSGMLGASRLMKLAAMLEADDYQSEDLPGLLDEISAACDYLGGILLKQ